MWRLQYVPTKGLLEGRSFVFRYNPNLKGNLYEKRAASITKQLLGSDMVVDYDQLLAKPPDKPDAEFKW